MKNKILPTVKENSGIYSSYGVFVAGRIKVYRDSLGEFSNTSYGVFGAERVQLFTVTHFSLFPN